MQYVDGTIVPSPAKISTKISNVNQKLKHVCDVIRNSCPEDSDDIQEIKNGRYILYHEGQAILPEQWDNFIDSGLSLELKLWKCDSVKFRDALGTEFYFPWSSIKTWEVSRSFPDSMP